MFLFGASDWAYVGGAIAVPLVSGLFGVVLWKLNGVYREVKSPNGATTASLNYDAWKTSMDLREQLAELREAQLDHRNRHVADALESVKSHRRLETKVDSIARAQIKHELRFAHLFDRLDVDDPVVEKGDHDRGHHSDPA